MKIIWLRRAREDVHRIREYIAMDKPTAARAVLAAIREHVARLREHPKLGRVGRKRGTRELVNAQYSHYITVYQIDGDLIYILRVLRDSQNWTPEDK